MSLTVGSHPAVSHTHGVSAFSGTVILYIHKIGLVASLLCVTCKTRGDVENYF